MTHKLKTEMFSQKIEYSGGVFFWPLTPLFSFISFHLKCVTKQHNLLLSPSESSQAPDEVGIPVGRGLIRLIIVLITNYFVCFLYSLNTIRIRGFSMCRMHMLFFLKR